MACGNHLIELKTANNSGFAFRYLELENLSLKFKYTANVRFKLIIFEIENEQRKTAQNYSFHTLLSK